MDIYSDILRRLQLRGSAYFCSDFRGPWGFNEPAAPHGVFHIVVAGQAWCQVEEQPAQLLNRGDIVVLPHGHAHWMADHPETRREYGPAVIDAVQGGEVPFDDGELTVTLLCGYFEYDERTPHPLLKNLPRQLLLSTEGLDDHGWLLSAVQALSVKSKSQAPGREVLVDRLTEVVLIEVVRQWLERHGDRVGLLSGLADPRLAKALDAIHSEPGHHWTVAELAGVAGMSRTSFSQSFHDRVGQPPLEYLTNWRMAVAREQLQRGDSVLAVALALGYGSDASFAKAFKKVLGITPGHVRKSAQ